MADWRLDQKTEETPQGTDLSLLVRGSSVFKTTFQKIKDFVIGTNAMGTEAEDVTGAINELKGKIDSNSSQLKEKANQSSLNTTNTNVSNHIAGLVSDINGIHGFKVETGTWTPRLLGISGGEATYTLQSGSYVRQGKTCLVMFGITTATKGNIASGALEIGGLPFNAIGETGADLAQLVFGEVAGITYPTNCNNLYGRFYRNTNVILLRFNKNDGTAGFSVVDTNIAPTTTIYGSMIYRIA